MTYLPSLLDSILLHFTEYNYKMIKYSETVNKEEQGVTFSVKGQWHDWGDRTS